MGLLDNLKPNSNPETDFVKVSEPSMGNDPDKTTWGDFEVKPPDQLNAQIFNQAREVPKMATEGIASGNDAADALFNNNTSTFSRALASKAQRFIASSKSSRTLNSEIENVKRQQLQQNQNLNTQNDLYKIKRQNFAGQLKFAAEMSNYQNTLSAMKISAITSVIGGVFKMGGKVAGGM